MNFYTVRIYLKYLFTAHHRKGHGVHSPFIFNLLSRMFRNKTPGSIVCTIEKIRKKLRADERIISVNDLGGRPAKQKPDRRKVSEIARNSAIPGKYGIVLANLAEEFGKSSILELGTSLGISTMYLAALSPGATVYTIEGCPECSSIAEENFRAAGLSNISPVTGSFEEKLPELISSGIVPDLVFIDGNHRKEPVLRYFSEIITVAGDDTVIIMDDISHSSEMHEAWVEIMNHERVTATIDLFRIGIVFFKQGITRNNYKIRY